MDRGHARRNSTSRAQCQGNVRASEEAHRSRRRVVTIGVQRSISRAGLARAAGRVCFVALPVVVTVVWMVASAHRDLFAANFRTSFWPAGDRVLRGMSPYVSTPADFEAGIGFPYSAAAGLFFAPFALLSLSMATALFWVLIGCSLFLTLRLLRVSDFRVFGAVLLWAPVLSAWQVSNVTLILGLGLAVVWTRRDRPMAAGIVFGLLVSLKMVIWPVAVWLLATRRYAAFAYSVACAAVVNAVAWTVVGFDLISPYLRLTRSMTRAQELKSYNLIAYLQLNGLSRQSSYVLQLACAIVAAVGCIVLGRLGRDRAACAVGVGMCMLFSPVVHLEYLALLVVPMALYRPRLHWAWLVPVAMVLPMAVFTGEKAWIAMVGAVVMIAGAARRTASPSTA